MTKEERIAFKKIKRTLETGKSFSVRKMKWVIRMEEVFGGRLKFRSEIVNDIHGFKYVMWLE